MDGGGGHGGGDSGHHHHDGGNDFPADGDPSGSGYDSDGPWTTLAWVLGCLGVIVLLCWLMYSLQ